MPPQRDTVSFPPPPATPPLSRLEDQLLGFSAVNEESRLYFAIA